MIGLLIQGNRQIATFFIYFDSCYDIPNENCSKLILWGECDHWETLNSIIAGYTSAITIVHHESQNNYKLKVKSLRVKQVSFYNI